MTANQALKDLETLISEAQEKVSITGLSGVKVDNVRFLIERAKRELKKVQVQFFDADKIASRRHLEFAAINALKAFYCGYNISKSFSMELML
ncbi:MAG: KEOPS complex subunit Cgi121, partial [Candidatus Bathyarchaeota archaeon]